MFNPVLVSRIGDRILWTKSGTWQPPPPLSWPTRSQLQLAVTSLTSLSWPVVRRIAAVTAEHVHRQLHASAWPDQCPRAARSVPSLRVQRRASSPVRVISRRPTPPSPHPHPHLTQLSLAAPPQALFLKRSVISSHLFTWPMKKASCLWTRSASSTWIIWWWVVGGLWWVVMGGGGGEHNGIGGECGGGQGGAVATPTSSLTKK